MLFTCLHQMRVENPRPFAHRLAENRCVETRAPISVCSQLSCSFGFPILVRKAIRATWGTSSFSSSTRFACSSVVTPLSPVTFTPGCARLVTTPFAIGSPSPDNTIGIVVVAFLAAKAAGVPLCKNQIDVLLDKFSCQVLEPLGAPIG